MSWWKGNQDIDVTKVKNWFGHTTLARYNPNCCFNNVAGKGKKHDADQIDINKGIMSGPNLLQKMIKIYFDQVQMAPFFSAVSETKFYTCLQ